jgi:hypothetical protein
MTADELRQQIAHYRSLERVIQDTRTRDALSYLIEVAETRVRLVNSPLLDRSANL